MTLRILRTPIAVALALGLLVGASASWAGWMDEREALDHRQVQGTFRVHYTLSGQNALSVKSGGKKKFSGGADALAAQVAAEMVNADQFYSQTLGLGPINRLRRYAPMNLTWVDVHFLRMEDKTASTGDAVVTYNYRKFKDAAPALTISLSTDWRPPGETPEHEVFHTYQYAYTFFKNAWFLEGMARSLEGAFDDHNYQTETLPANQTELDVLLGRTYSASRFWSRLMALCDPGCAKTWDGAYFTSQAAMCGGGLVKSVLEQFQSIDPLAAAERGLSTTDWPEAEQWSSKNTPWMLRGLGRAIDQQCPVATNPELGRFRAVLTNAVGN